MLMLFSHHTMQQSVLQSTCALQHWLLVWWEKSIRNEYPARTYSESEYEMWCAQKGEKQLDTGTQRDDKELDTGTQRDDNVLCSKFVPPLKPELKKTEVDDCSWSATQIDSKNAYGYSSTPPRWPQKEKLAGGGRCLGAARGGCSW